MLLQGNLRYAGGRSTIPSLRSRADRHLYTFLFKRLMLLTKKDDDGYQYKTHLEVCFLFLTMFNLKLNINHGWYDDQLMKVSCRFMCLLSFLGDTC